MKVSIMLMLMAISAVGNAYFIPNIQCACQQILSQTECNNWNCQWVTTSASGVTPVIGYCQQVSCASLSESQCKNQSERCYYQESSKTTQQVCYDLSTCEDIILTTGTTCQESNSKCVPSPLQKPQCISSGQSCQGLTQNQCSPGKGWTLADEGLCYWNGSSCKVVSQCAEINSQNQCELPLFVHACQWTGTQCLPQTCQSLFTQSGQCTFIQSTPQKGSNYTPCNQVSTDTCTNGVTQLLTQSNCAANTNYHYRWVSTNGTNGFCIECNPVKYVFRNQCECQQLLQKNECQTAGNCLWTPTTTGASTGTCSANPCSTYTLQQKCAQVKGCFWNALSTEQTPVCAPYTSCSSIAGQNAQTCYSLSIYCPGSNGTTCQSQQQLSKCESISAPNACYNSIGSDGFCTYNTGSKQCESITSCSLLSSLELCNQFSNSCIWQTGKTHSCTNKTCSDFYTESSCTYIQNSINNNIINICAWNPNTKKCTTFDNSFSYDVNSCYSSTGRTHHWSEPSNAQKGLCLPCHYSSVLTVKSKCVCSQLTNYTDCALAAPNCQWNVNTSQCQNQVCSQLTSQATCILSKYCNWSAKTSSCQPTGSSTITCSTLTANTQQECLSQSIVCAGINSSGKCSTTPNSCSDFNTFYQCFGSVGTDGVCQWNQTTLQCQGISKCDMISTPAQCELVLNTCFWNSEGNGTCNAYNCSSLQSQNRACNYYLTSPNQNYQVKYCTMSGSTCTETSSLSSLTSSNCYASSGGTAFWDSGKGNGTCVQCYSQLISVLFLILSYML